MSNKFYKQNKFVTTSQSFVMLILTYYVGSFSNDNFSKRKTG